MFDCRCSSFDHWSAEVSTKQCDDGWITDSLLANAIMRVRFCAQHNKGSKTESRQKHNHGGIFVVLLIITCFSWNLWIRSNAERRKERKGERNYLSNKDELLKQRTSIRRIIRRLALDDKSFHLFFAHLFLIFAYRSSSWTGYISVVYYFLIPLIYSHRIDRELRRQDSQDSHLSSLLISTTHYIPLFLHTNLMTLLLRAPLLGSLSEPGWRLFRENKSTKWNWRKHRSKIYFLELIFSSRASVR